MASCKKHTESSLSLPCNQAVLKVTQDRRQDWGWSQVTFSLYEETKGTGKDAVHILQSARRGESFYHSFKITTKWCSQVMLFIYKYRWACKWQGPMGSPWFEASLNTFSNSFMPWNWWNTSVFLQRCYRICSVSVQFMQITTVLPDSCLLSSDVGLNRLSRFC